MLINWKFVYWLLAYTENKRIACWDTWYFISNKAWLPFAYHVRPETVWQYTWLKDKNWVEIYEFDYVEYKWNTYKLFFNKFSISLENISNKDIIDLTDEILSDLFIKWNIYENK